MDEEVATVEGRRPDLYEHFMRSWRTYGDIIAQAEVVTSVAFVELILVLPYGNLHLIDYRRGSS